mgnify:CR=1 FL=1
MVELRGRPKKAPKVKDLLYKYIPAADIFVDDQEKDMYDGLVKVYLQDFDEEQLTANDMDDIMSIAMNRVLELRLLKASKETDKQLETSSAIEKLRKQTDKLKDNLANRRKDRIDPKKYTGLSIVDLAVNFDMEKQREKYEAIEKLRQEEEEVVKSPLLKGNRDDEDARYEGE